MNDKINNNIKLIEKSNILSDNDKYHQITMAILSYDLLQIIFNRLDFISQIRYQQIDSFIYGNFHMRNFYDITNEIKVKLSNDILENYLYITRLNVSKKY